MKPTLIIVGEGERMPTFNSIIAWVVKNDMPNTVAFVLTSILWPLALFWWNTRWVRSVSNLQLSIGPSKMTIGGQTHDSVEINLLNNTGKVVYITQARLFPQAAVFPVHIDSSRNLADSSYELNFLKPGGAYELKQITIQTGGEAKTALALDRALDASVRKYTGPCWRQLIGRPKFFKIQYIAMVGNRRHKVSTVH